MSSIIENSIKILGIADELPKNPLIFKQICLEENLMISHEKPNIQQIISAMVDIIISDKKIIKTPIEKSLEGQNLTGKALIVEGYVRQKLEYVADVEEQIVHGAYFNIPFSTFIILPKEDKDYSNIDITGYIQDVYISLIDKKTMFESIAILIDVKF